MNETAYEARFDPPLVTEATCGVRMVRDAVVARVSGLRWLTLDVHVPIRRRRVPVVAWIHGGAWWTGSNKTYGDEVPARIRDALLDAGVAVASVSYRFSGEAVFPAQLHDVKAAIRWMRHHAGDLRLDPDRVGAWGASAGGHLAALLAVTGDRPDLDGDLGVTEGSSRIAAAVAWYPPTDLARMQSQVHLLSAINHDAPDSPESRLLGAPVQTAHAPAAAASPTTYVHPGAAPLRLVHGTDDRLVPIGQSRILAGLYERAGAEVEFHPVAGADHGFPGLDIDPLIASGVDFLTRHLRR